MAWSERLPSGKYRGVYRDGAGKKRSAGVFSHKPQAVRVAGSKEKDARSLLWRDPEAFKRPWGEWADEWVLTRRVEATTAATDALRRRKHLDPQWAGIPIGSITRHDVKSWAAGMRNAGVGAGTVQRAVHLLSASLNAAVDAEVLAVNPAARIKLDQGAQAVERFLTRGEFDAVREQMPTKRDQLVLDLLVTTGLRWSELAGLHWSRVDLGRGVLTVVEVFDPVTGRMKAYPKGKRVRVVPLTADLVQTLQGLPVAGVSCGVEHVSGRCRSALVVSTDSGTPLRNSNWSPLWREALEHAGVGHARIHDLRHSYASWLLQAGIPLAEVGRLLGHISTQTTARYAHLAEPPSAAILAALAAPKKPHALV